MIAFLRKKWWKIGSLVLIAYALVGGLLLPAPALDILNETIRNLHYHVPMWFGMIFLLLISLIFSMRYLNKFDPKADLIAKEMARTGIVFGLLGLTTGMIWAEYTWGDWWNGDPKQNMSAIALLIYLAYFVLRNAIDEPEKRARIAAVFNIFAFFAMIVLLFVIPRLTDSLHPSNGGNQGFVVYDLDSSLRLVFYPATIGFIGLGLWLSSFQIRRELAFKRRFPDES